MSESARPHYRDIDELAHLDRLTTTLWVFDVDRHSMWWGNQSALKFWKADSIEALRARDFSTDSETVRLRLRRLVDLPDGQGNIQDTWTLYPQSSPVAVNLDLRPVTIEDGRNAILIEASYLPDLSAQPESLRILEAARSSAILVSTFTLNGQLLSQNPAAHECYSSPQNDSTDNELARRFGDRALAQEVLQAMETSGLFEDEVAVLTAEGRRIHRVIARKGRDPITGQFVTVINEEDRTEQARLRDDLQALNLDLEQRVAARTEALERANRKLREEISERQAVEEKLRKSQRLEAIGQLTGGIAHDFNNILAVILGNLDLLKKGPPMDESIDMMRMAVDRGAELTQRLLAYSRKQPLSPKATPLDELVYRTVDLLRRTLGESIRIEVVVAPDLWPVRVDPGQLENAIVNVALNARDAMPDGGLLQFRCENVQIDGSQDYTDDEFAPGDYGVLSIQDSGEGMTAQVRAQAFEPFFTTKEVGQGSGLGLSMVYGFAKQSGGTVTLVSRAQQGTTLKLYLPRSSAQPAGDVAPVGDAPPRAGGETVLVIEDNADLLTIISSLLEQLGYRVLTAEDASAAQRQLDRSEKVDLALADVVLPNGVSGPEFVVQARRDAPSLKAIYMSGYPRESLDHAGLKAAGAAILHKPFNRSELAAALRAALQAER
ncbi:MAG: response regulator [Pseudomonadota bacterium]